MVRTLKQVECPPECGFLARTHDDNELVRILQAHGREFHGLENLTARDILAGAKVVAPAR